MQSANDKCSGCGAALQSDDPGAPGYVPPRARERFPVVCQRCFRMKHYNEASGVTPDQDQFLRMLGGIGHTDGLVVHIVDLFDFEGSLIGGLARFVGRNPILLAANKIDLLPASVNPNRIRNWVQRRAKEEGLRPVDTVLVSAKNGTGVDRLAEAMEAHRRGRDVYMVGAANAGKSSLVNRLIRDFSEPDAEVTVSAYPGTTLDLIRIPLESGGAVVDTPGILFDFRLTEVAPKSALPQLVPDRPLRPATYQLDPGQTLFFGALVRFDYVEGGHRPFTCYTSPKLPIHRTKLEKADALYAEHAGELLRPPGRDELAQMPPLVRHRFRIRAGEAADVVVAGLGWVRVHGEGGATVDVHAPKGVRAGLRPAMI